MASRDLSLIVKLKDLASKQVKEVKDKFVQLGTKLKETGKDFVKLDKNTKKTKEEFGKLDKKLKETERDFDKVDTATKKTKEGLGKTGTATQTLISRFKNLAKSLLASKLSWVVLSAAIGLSLKQFAAFEAKMIDVVNLFGGSREEVQKFGDTVLDISRTVPQSAQDLANSLFDIVSAGVDASEATEFLAVAAKLATAGVTDTKTAVDGLTSVLNAYSLSSDKALQVSDQFFQAQKFGKTTIAELSNSVGRLAPLAESAGLSIDEMFASLATLTNQGIKTEESVVAMRGALTAILGPTAEAKKLANELGLEFNSTALRSKGLIKFMQDLQTATEGDVDKINVLFGNVRALNGVLALSKNEFSKLIEVQKGLEKSSGSTEKAFKLQMTSMSAQTKIFKNNFGSMSKFIVGSLAPAITGSIKLMNKFFEFTFNGLDKVTAKQVEGLKKVITFTKEQIEDAEKDGDNARVRLLKKNEEEARELLKIKSKKLGIDVELEFKTSKEIEEIKKKALTEIKRKEAETLAQKLKDNAEIIEDEDRTIKDILNKHNFFKDELFKNDEEILESKVRLLKSILKEETLTKEEQKELNRDLFDLETKLDNERVKTLEKNVSKSIEIGRGLVTNFNKTISDMKDNAIGLVTGQLEKAVVSGFTSMASGLGSTMQNIFGGVGGIAGGAAGAALGQFISKVIFDSGGKSVAEIAKEQLTQFRKESERVLSRIGKKESETEKQLELLRELKEVLGVAGEIPKQFLENLGFTEGTTVGQAETGILKRLQGVESEDVKADTQELALRKAQLEELGVINEIRKQFEKDFDVTADFGKSLAETNKILIDETNKKLIAAIKFTTDKTFRDIRTIVDTGNANLQAAAGLKNIRGGSGAAQSRITELEEKLRPTSEFSLDEQLAQLRLEREIAESKGEVPEFQTGGIFNAPTGQTKGLAVLHDGEQVTPSNGRSSQSTTININNGIFMGDRNNARELAKMIDEELVVLSRTNQRIS